MQRDQLIENQHIQYIRSCYYEIFYVKDGSVFLLQLVFTHFKFGLNVHIILRPVYVHLGRVWGAVTWPVKYRADPCAVSTAAVDMQAGGQEDPILNRHRAMWEWSDEQFVPT